MECPKCKNPLKEGARFCGKCGTKTDQPAGVENNPQGSTCPKCGNSLKPGVKFCGKCGAVQETVRADASAENPNKGYVIFEMQPGQIAQRLTETLFSQYHKSPGIVIPEGFLAMVMCGGKLQTMLDAGTYHFGKTEGDGSIKEFKLSTFFAKLFNGKKRGTQEQNQRDSDAILQAEQNRVPVEIVVCRSSNFSLPFIFKNMATKTIRVDAGLMLSLQISNVVELYKRYMIDRTVLASETLANELISYIEGTVQESMSDFAPENILLNSEFKNLLSRNLKDIFTAKFPFIEFLDIVKIETKREELRRLEHLSEEMYLSERELEQLMRRNEFMNRLSQEQNSAELQNASNAADFNRRLAEINRDNLLTGEEMTNLQREIQERSEDHAFDRAKAMELMVIQHKYQVQSAQVKMEEEIGARLFNIQQERQRQTDNYSDERRKNEIELDKKEQMSQLDVLKQAQDIRQQREKAEHDRKLEANRQAQMHEMDKLHVYTSMSAEQIMVANPNITPEAAKAMAEKFKAEAATAASDTRAQNAMEQTRMMKEFMEQQMMTVRDMANSNAQALTGIMGAREREIERTQHIIDKNEDRYAGVVREKIKAGNFTAEKTCSKCGHDTGNELFCPECGTRIN